MQMGHPRKDLLEHLSEYQLMNLTLYQKQTVFWCSSRDGAAFERLVSLAKLCKSPTIWTNVRCESETYCPLCIKLLFVLLINLIFVPSNILPLLSPLFWFLWPGHLHIRDQLARVPLLTSVISPLHVGLSAEKQLITNLVFQSNAFFAQITVCLIMIMNLLGASTLMMLWSLNISRAVSSFLHQFWYWRSDRKFVILSSNSYSVSVQVEEKRKWKQKNDNKGT